MSVLADYFLRAKHWQIFLLFGIFFVGTMVSMVPASVTPTHNFGGVGLLFVVVNGLGYLCFMAWWWSLGSFLCSLVLPALRLNLRFFRFTIIYPLIYMFVFLAFLAFFGNPLPVLFAVIVPLHLLAMFCMFYGLYFVSKSLVMAETGKSASFYDYAGPFFLIWFIPIGVWTVQPRINRLYANKKNAELLPG
jgi:hypothetical protein